MRILVFVLVLILIACHNKQPDQNIESSRMATGPDSSVAIGKISFESRDQSSIEYSSDTLGVSIHSTNVNYSEKLLNRQHTLDYYIVKQNQQITEHRGSEGVDSRITLDIFSTHTWKPIRTITKSADIVNFSSRGDYLISTRYGCCGGEDYSELSEVWQDNTFLAYNDKYYIIDIPNARLQFFFGYLTEVYDKDKLIHGELHFAHSYGTLDSGKKFYTNSYILVSKIIFKARNRSTFDRISGFSPEITLLKHTEKDEISDHQDHQQLTLWSYDKHTNLEGIDFLALRLTFQDDTTLNIEIPIKDGYLYGDTKPERTVYFGE